MNKTKARFEEALAQNCPLCLDEIARELGPLLGPERPPKPRVDRWSMTPAEWAGGWL